MATKMNLPDNTFVRMPVPKDPWRPWEISCRHCRMLNYSGEMSRCAVTGSRIEYDYIANDDCPFVIALREDEHDR